MKKNITFFLLTGILLFHSGVWGQSVSKARRFLLMEHFTNASCAPCGIQNPVFRANVSDVFPYQFAHIAYHTDWPGTDPMNAANPDEVQNRVEYYEVTGVPYMAVEGNLWSGGPAGFDASSFAAYSAANSPVRVKVSLDGDGTAGTATVNVSTLNAIPEGAWKLRVALVEEIIDFTSMPGNNGESEFDNVFRKFITDQPTGDSFEPAPLDGTATYAYNFTYDSTWDVEKIYAIAWIQKDDNKDVLNAGSSRMAKWELIADDAPQASHLTSGEVTSFSSGFVNLDDVTGMFRFTLDAPGMPASWGLNGEVNGEAFSNSVELAVEPGAGFDIGASILPDQSPGLGVITITVESIDHPEQGPQVLSYYYISRVKEIVLNNTGGLGDGNGGNATQWQDVFIGALQLAGAQCQGVTDRNILVALARENALEEVKVIYYNVGWTFPSFTDEFADELENWLGGNGKCLFLCGQDLAWEMFNTDNPAGTFITQNFFLNRLKVGYVSDGGPANTILTPVSSDELGASLISMNINPYYGTTYYYPDELEVREGGEAFFNYNNGTKVSGIRYDNGNYKSAYLGVGLEMLDNDDAQLFLFNLREWFFSDGEDACIEEPSGIAQINETKIQVFPVPANDYIQFQSSDPTVKAYQIINPLGEIVKQIAIDYPLSVLTLSTDGWPNGIYWLVTNDGVHTTDRQAFIIQK